MARSQTAHGVEGIITPAYDPPSRVSVHTGARAPGPDRSGAVEGVTQCIFCEVRAQRVQHSQRDQWNENTARANALKWERDALAHVPRTSRCATDDSEFSAHTHPGQMPTRLLWHTEGLKDMCEFHHQVYTWCASLAWSDSANDKDVARTPGEWPCCAMNTLIV